MQVYTKSNTISLKTFLFFLLTVFIAFLPVSSFLFFLKNDAFTGYFPPKFFMSESLHSGFLPLWNPYINFGIPQYGDMSSGFWSPITWLIASTVGYNAYTFTIEVLFYILIGGLGFYRLLQLWVIDKRVRIIGAIAFMCCGYNVGHLQHFNWLSGAAFLPWCLWSYILLLKKFSLRQLLISVLVFYLLVSSAHPGISISAFYFFLAILLFYFFKNEEKFSLAIRTKYFIKLHLIFIFLLLLVSSGMICGYLDILPHFVRGNKISLEASLSNPTTLQSWISALLPFAAVTHNTFFNTDPSMRNSYFGLVLLLFFLLACFQKKNSTQIFFLITGIAFMLLSAGGIFKTIAYHFVPFIGYVRLNGEFTIYTILCFIIFASIELDKHIRQNRNFNSNIKWIYYTVEITLSACLFFGLYKAISNKQSFLFSGNHIFSATTLPFKIKALIDSITFYDTLWVQGIIQLFFLWGIKYCLKFSNWNLLKNLAVMNMAIACLMNIPFTGVGKMSAAQIQSILNKSPKGIPKPQLQPIKNNDTLNFKEPSPVGDWSMYNKQIGVKNEVPYPIILKNMREYFEGNQFDKNNIFLNQPFVFISPADKNNSLLINSFSPDKISIATNTDISSQLILQQNFYPHWFYKNENEKKEVNRAGINFISAPLLKGTTITIFSFEPKLVKWLMLFSAVIFVILLLLIFRLNPK